MSKKCKREFKVKDIVYLADYWGVQASRVRGRIVKVDEKKQTFDVIIYGDIYQRYKFEDYGRLVFDTPEEAEAVAEKLPKPDSFVYQKIGNRVYRKKVVGITGRYFDNGYDLIIVLNKGKSVSVKELGISLFLNESDARQSKK